MQILKDETYKDFITDNDKAVIYLWASWCGPCRKLSPLMAELEQEHDGIKFGKIDADEAKDFLNEFSISAVPVVFFFENQQLMKTIIGAHPKLAYELELEEMEK